MTGTTDINVNERKRREDLQMVFSTVFQFMSNNGRVLHLGRGIFSGTNLNRTTRHISAKLMSFLCTLIL